MKLSEAEWAVLNILWSGTTFSLKEITMALQEVNGWNKNTVLTYLTRMEKKGYVSINRSQVKPYSAAVSKEFCAKKERTELLDKVYGGATGDLIAVPPETTGAAAGALAAGAATALASPNDTLYAVPFTLILPFPSEVTL